VKVLITGADGLLGSNLVRLLLERKYQVSVFIHPSSTSKTLDNLDIERYYGDILKEDEIENAISRVDSIIHVAAMTNIWPARSELVNKVNIDGTKMIIKLALKHKLKRMVYIGSASSVNTTDTSNKYPFAAAKFGLDYIDSKYYALKEVLKAAKNDKLPAIAILPTYMIGPYDSLPSSGKMIIAIAKGKLKFFSGGGRNIVYVNDVATAIVNALEMGEIGKYYIAGNENLSYKEFFTKVSSIVHSKAPKVRVPNWATKSFGFVLEKSAIALHKQPMISYPMARISCENQFAESNDAIEELMMPQTPVTVAIKECFDWFLQNGYCNKQEYIQYETQ
jgi:dihydroflavonol-4-reductase